MGKKKPAAEKEGENGVIMSLRVPRGTFKNTPLTEAQKQDAEEEKGRLSSRDKEIKEREKNTPQAKKVRPLSKTQTKLLREDITAVVPRARIKQIPTKAATVDITSGSEVFSVKENNLIRAILRKYGAVDVADGRHFTDADYEAGVIGNIVMDDAGQHEKYKGEKSPIPTRDWEMGFGDYFKKHPKYKDYLEATKSEGTGGRKAIEIISTAKNEHADIIKKARESGRDV